MPIATADQVRTRTILVQLPGSDLQLQCRRPDPIQLIADGILPLETYAAVLEELNSRMAQPDTLDNRPIKSSSVENPKTFMQFVDRWVCAAVVAPPVVLTEDEATENPAALWVAHLETEVRLEVVVRTNTPLMSKRVTTAVTDFRRQRSVGAGAGPDGAAIQHDAVEAAAHA